MRGLDLANPEQGVQLALQALQNELRVLELFTQPRYLEARVNLTIQIVGTVEGPVAVGQYRRERRRTIEATNDGDGLAAQRQALFPRGGVVQPVCQPRQDKGASGTVLLTKGPKRLL